MADSETRKTQSVFSLFKKAYELVRKNLNVYGVVYFIPGALAVAGVIALIADNSKSNWQVGNLFSSAVFGPNWTGGDSIGAGGAFLALVIFLLMILVSLLSFVLNLRVAQDKKISFKSIWEEFWSGWLWLKLIGLSVVTTVIIVVGFILLIIPGIIMLWRLFLAPYVMIDKKATIDEAISQSWRMSKGYFVPIYTVILLGVLLSVTGVIPIIGGLISFALSVAYGPVAALRYQELKHHSS